MGHRFELLKRRAREHAVATGVPSKPEGYVATSIMSYYNVTAAKNLKPILDKIIAERCEYTFPSNNRKSVNTIYAKVYQAWRFLADHMDEADARYTTLRGQTSIVKYRTYVRIEWGGRTKRTLGYQEGFTGAQPIAPDDPSPLSWREEIMQWATGPDLQEGAILEKKITLTPDEQEWLKAYILTGFADIVAVRVIAQGYKLVKNTRLAQALREEMEGQ